MLQYVDDFISVEMQNRLRVVAAVKFIERFFSLIAVKSKFRLINSVKKINIGYEVNMYEIYGCKGWTSGRFVVNTFALKLK